MIQLAFPPSILSGHSNGNNQWGKINATKEWREKARKATIAAGYADKWADGICDIGVHVSFCPPDRRSDRVNYPNRMKPIFDGIADALGVNDVRFVPEFHFCPVEAPGRVEVRLSWRSGIKWGEAA